MSTTGTAEARPRRLGAERASIVVLFLCAGAVAGAWAGRIPTVKAQVGLGDAEWGSAILAQPIGLALGLIIVTRVIAKVGARPLVISGAVGMLITAPITASQQVPLTLILCLTVQGLFMGFLHSPMNALAVTLQKDYGRSILSSFHACYSIGQMSGALIGAPGGQPW